MLNRIRQNLLITVGLALAYFVTARIGIGLSIGPGQITAVWPPSGIALAALMVWGLRALPGLAAGAFAMNYGAYLGPVAGFTAASAWGALALTAGSMLQAGLAASLLRELPAQLRTRTVRETLRFAMIVGACCLIAAAIGQATLLGLDVIRQVELFFGAVTWWVGDTTGMLVFAPLALLLLHPALRDERVTLQAFPIICGGLGLTLFTTFSMGVVARDGAIEAFRADAARLAMSLQNHAEMSGRDLETLQHYFYKVDLDAAEFRAVSTPLLARSPWQVNFAWLPRVPRAGRAAFESEAGGLGGIEIHELAIDGSVVRAQPRAEHFPVAWTDPQGGREALIGVDHAADGLRGPALARARALDRIAATAPLRSLAHSTDLRLVQTLYLPVVARDASIYTPYDAATVRGVIGATIDLAALLQASASEMGVRDQHLLLFDPHAPESAALERDADGHVAAVDATVRERLLEQLSGGISRTIEVGFGDRRWRVVSQPGWAGTMPAPSRLQGAVFGSGLAFTALLSGFLIVRRRRDEVLLQARHQLETQVQTRTADLASTNRRLSEEVDGHRRTAVMLQDATRRAEAASHAKSLFLANMSHEIRTPLNAVLGYTQLLIEDRRLPVDVRERLRVIQSAANRLLSLINDVLDLAKIEAGGLQLSIGPMDLRRELDDLGALFAPRAEAKGLELRLEIDLDSPQVLLGDRAKLGQIVLNLLGNALKFTDAGRITLRAWRLEGQTWIEVIDTGPGMSAQELADVFTPFRQGQAGIDKGGSGLGLSLSRNIAQALGGELEIDSTPGRGTCVRLRLPMAAAQAEPAPSLNFHGGQRLAPETPCRVLVVEDDPHSRDVLVALLEQSGCTVAQAVDGNEGLAACLPDGLPPDGPLPFDIVFSDIRMPHLDGLQMMLRLRQDARARALPLVAVSASSLAHERRFYIEQGFTDFVSKPYAFDAIYAMLVMHARVRLLPVDAPADLDDPAPPAAAPAPPAAGLPGPVRERLVALADAASGGQMSQVRRLLADIGADALASGHRTQLELDLRAYDFAALEERVRTWLAEDDALQR